MPHLVAIDLPGGDGFVDALRRIWDAGDAAFPIDRRLPPAARQVVLSVISPDRLLDEQGIHELDGFEVEARPIEPRPIEARPIEARPIEARPIEARPIEEGDALVVATSGTTGVPRGVVLTHDAVQASAAATSARLEVTRDDTWLACLPLSHVGGLSVVTRAIVTGSRLVVHDGFDPVAVAAAASQGVTLVSLVPTTLQRVDPNLFRRIVLGGSRPPDVLPGNVVATYGMTETGSGVVYDRRPLDGVEIRIGPDDEIHIRCPMLLRCYRDGSTPLVDGWFPTGDLGKLDDRGELTVYGRRGDMIITGGENVWPVLVESVVKAHPSVAEVAVAGAPDIEWGQRVVAWIVPVDAGDPPTLTSIRSLVAETLPIYMAPKEIRLVDSLPLTSSGKVRRHDLSTSPTKVASHAEQLFGNL